MNNFEIVVAWQKAYNLHYAGVKADSVINVLVKVVSELLVLLQWESFKGAALFNAGRCV